MASDEREDYTLKRVAKRSIALCLALLLTLACAGCGGTLPGGAYSYEEPSALSGTLTVYSQFVQWDYEKAFSNFKKAAPDLKVTLMDFNSWEGLVERVLKDIKEGTLPDLIITPPMWDAYDIGRLAQEGYLADLQPYLDADTSYHGDNYYESVLQGGVIDHKQYIMPLCFTPGMFFCTEDTYKQAGLDLQAGYTALDLYAAMHNYIESFDKTKAGFDYPFLSLGLSVPYELIQMAGVRLFDPDTRTLTLPDNEIPEEVLQLAVDSAFAELDLRANPPIGFSPRGDAGAFAFIGRSVAFSYRQYQMNYTRLFDMNTMTEIGSGGKLKVVPVPLYNDATKYSATIKLCGAIPTSSTNPAAAYSLLRYLMDFDASTNSYGFSISRDVNAAQSKKATEKGYGYVADVEHMLDNLGMVQLAPCEYMNICGGRTLGAYAGGQQPPADTLLEPFYRSIEYYLQSETYYDLEGLDALYG